MKILTIPFLLSALLYGQAQAAGESYSWHSVPFRHPLPPLPRLHRPFRPIPLLRK